MACAKAVAVKRPRACNSIRMDNRRLAFIGPIQT
jgi:hypothetical protein